MANTCISLHVFKQVICSSLGFWCGGILLCLLGWDDGFYFVQLKMLLMAELIGRQELDVFHLVFLLQWLQGVRKYDELCLRVQAILISNVEIQFLG